MPQTNTAVLDIVEQATPHIADAILRASGGDYDEDFWLQLLHDADSQNGQGLRGRSFDDFDDLMDVLEFHSRWLQRGVNPLIRSQAGGLRELHDQARLGVAIQPNVVAWFHTTLNLLLEALGVEGLTAPVPVSGFTGQSMGGLTAPSGATPDVYLPSPVRGPVRTLSVRGVDVEVEWAGAYNGALLDLNVSPLRSVTLHNTGDRPAHVDSLKIVGPSSAPEWSGPTMVLPADGTVVLTHAEAVWAPEWDGSTGADLDGEFMVSIEGRSASQKFSIPTVEASAWNLDLPAEAIGGLIPFDSERVGTLTTVVAGRVAWADDPTSTDYMDAIEAELSDLQPMSGVYCAGTSVIRDVETLWASGEATGTERALIVAGILAHLKLPTVILAGSFGLRAGIGRLETSVFSPEHMTAGGFQADLAGLTVFDGTPTSEEIRYMVTLEELLERTARVAVPGSDIREVPQEQPPAVSLWLKQLLQLDYRNSLLRLPKSAGVQIIVPPTALPEFEDAFSNGERFDLQPAATARSRRARMEPAEDFSELFDAHCLSIDARGSATFNTRLGELQRKSARTREESGKNIIHAVVGVLEWLDDKNETSHSPLFIAPANLQGDKERGFSLALEPGYDLAPNYTLHEKIRQITRQDITALVEPEMDDSGIDVDLTFERISTELNRAGIQHSILRQVLVLSLDFATQALWSDLRTEWSRLLSRPVPWQLALGTGTGFNDPVPGRNLTVTDQVDTRLVYPADGSQLKSVVWASAGKSFVLEGPPGTGKSQTITNMIADGIARGRKVLFVAEKRAALDVVLTRLREAGLGDLVLDLHDSKQSLRDALIQLRAALIAHRDREDDTEPQLERLRATVDALESYPRAMFTDEARGSIWSLLQRCLQQESEFDHATGWQPEEISLPTGMTDEGLERAHRAAKNLRRARRRMDIAADSAPTAESLQRAAEELSAEGFADVASQVLSGRSADQLAEALDLAYVRAGLHRRLADAGVTDTSGSREDTVDALITLVNTTITRCRTEIPAQLTAYLRSTGLDRDFVQFVRRASSGSVRSLFERFGDQVLATTPCVLMSPQGVAAHLPVVGAEFDTVIFDEASQIRTSNAMSALGRARSAVIVGDRKQMPPSSDFSGLTSGDGSAAPATGTVRGESLLTMAAEAGLDRLSLDWHYRSADERLIAFSNRRYYEGRLITFPRAPEDAGSLPISYRFVGGVQEKVTGLSSKVNTAERDAVLRDVSTILAEDHDLPLEEQRSIMVVTFNAGQQAYIEHVLEDADDPLICAALSRTHEPLTVKNVETVQGDERDVVLFSMTYAPDKRTGKMVNNLGPLARGGGELRFNVAITRARREIRVIASMRASDIKLNRSTGEGVRDLREFLLIAESGELPAIQQAQQGEDLLRAGIREGLEAGGLEVVENVGESEFSVDLAVKAPDSDEWNAVLLDSPGWAERTTGWDRDGLPKVQLESRMGWRKVVRLLAADWVRDAGSAVDWTIKRLRSDEVEAVAEADVLTGPVEVSAETEPEEWVVDEPLTADPFTPASHAVEPLAPAPDVPVEVELRTLPVSVNVDEKGLLDQAAQSPSAKQRIIGYIEEIVDVEGPLDREALVRRTARRLGHAKPRQSTREAIAALVTMTSTDEGAGRVFIWPDGVDPSTYNLFRTPAPGAAARTLPEIPLREAGNALVHILSDEFDLDYDELFERVVNTFGGKKRTAKARTYFDLALQRALSDKRIDRDWQGRYISA